MESSLSGPSVRLVDSAVMDHEQLQENEDGRHDQAEPELPSLLPSLAQHLEHKLVAENREDP